MSRKSPTFQPLKIDPTTCSAKVRDEHLHAFINSFVRSKNRERARHIIFRKCRRRQDELSKLAKLLDERYTVHTSQSSPLSPVGTYSEKGVFFDGTDDAWIMKLNDAAIVASYHCRDIILSIEAGIYAVFLHHDAGTWLCERNHQ